MFMFLFFIFILELSPAMFEQTAIFLSDLQQIFIVIYIGLFFESLRSEIVLFTSPTVYELMGVYFRITCV
jgi:hypothetical protein